ncbi:MAG: hypothetical protein ACRD4X_11790 [Candidatus Acidiferrales bacterium]
MTPTHPGEERRIVTDDDPRRNFFAFRKMDDVVTLILFFHEDTVLRIFCEQLTYFQDVYCAKRTISFWSGEQTPDESASRDRVQELLEVMSADIETS